MAHTYNHIPDELLEKILLPQPVKSLVQWKCVCKSWNQVISHKSFIKAYSAHQKSSQNTHRYFLLNYRDPPSFLRLRAPFISFPDFDPYDQGYCDSRYSECCSYYSASRIDRKSFNVLESYNDICCRESTEHCFEVYGICDGLLCLSVHADILNSNPPIFLYNPVIRKGKKLIPPNLDHLRGFYPGTGYTFICFGCHDDDYKVIKVDYIRHTYEVFIYSLNTDSWKFIKIEDVAGTSNNKCTFDICPYPKTKLVNGVAYFIQGNQVVCFDLDCEIFRKIQWPTGFDSHDHIIMEEYGESIALIGSAPSHDRNTGKGVVMWVLRQSENSFTWEKKFTLEARRNNELLPETFPEICGPPNYPAVQAMGGFINNNELVMRRWTNQYKGYILREYFLYNAENGYQEQIQTPEERTGKAFLQRINILTESLVLLSETSMPPIPSLKEGRSACYYNKNSQKVTYTPL